MRKSLLLSAALCCAAPAAAEPGAEAFAFCAAQAAKPGNIVFSPYSLRTAFAMAYEGARGNTAAEIAKVFSFGTPQQARAEAASAAQQLKKAAGGAEFSQASAFWAQDGYKFLPAYVKTLREGYSAEARNADFRKPEKARAAINSWTAKRTAGSVKELFPQGSLDPMTRLVLVNAARFKAAWRYPFMRELTQAGDFNRADGSKVKAMFMTSPSPLRTMYSENDELQALSLPYKDGTLEMLLLLPRPGRGTAELAQGLTPQKLAALRAAMARARVKVAMPRFRFGAPYRLNDALAALGMPTAFTDAADLSGMDGTRKLYIQNAFHKAFIDVNEEGTEAAAASGVAAGEKSMAFENAVFRADRPFIFLIEDAATGLVLFMGRLDDPAAQG